MQKLNMNVRRGRKCEMGSFTLKTDKKGSLEKRKLMFVPSFLVSHKLTPVERGAGRTSAGWISGMLSVLSWEASTPQQKSALNHCGMLCTDFSASRKGKTTAFSVNLFRA